MELRLINYFINKALKEKIINELEKGEKHN